MHIATLQLMNETKKHPDFATAAKELDQAKKEASNTMKKISTAIENALDETDSEIKLEDDCVSVVPRPQEDA